MTDRTYALKKATRVLVLVKASPQPSRQYGDTVCVAGVEIDTGTPRWIRLYPVPFRCLDGSNQFRKYDIISVSTRDAGAIRELKAGRSTPPPFGSNVSSRVGRAATRGFHSLKTQACATCYRWSDRTSTRNRSQPCGLQAFMVSSSPLIRVGRQPNWNASSSIAVRGTCSGTLRLSCSTRPGSSCI